jgi:DNA-binding response OmpR family regulator
VAEILLIDDDVDYLESFGEMLSAAGHGVRIAGGGREGLAALNQALPDMVFLDVDMPVLTGPDVAWRMCIENLGKERVPVLFVSANPDVAAIAARVGTRYFLTKPFDFRVVTVLIERIISERSPPAWPERDRASPPG